MKIVLARALTLVAAVPFVAASWASPCAGPPDAGAHGVSSRRSPRIRSTSCRSRSPTRTAETERLRDRRGQPMLVSMFYTSCQFVCPMIVDALREHRIEVERRRAGAAPHPDGELRPRPRQRRRPQGQGRERELDSPHWTLARTDAAARASSPQSSASSTGPSPTATSTTRPR